MKATFGELYLHSWYGDFISSCAVAGIRKFAKGADAALLGKEVTTAQLPATKEGIDVYYSRKGIVLMSAGWI
jgi:hypothetical protein